MVRWYSFKHRQKLSNGKSQIKWVLWKQNLCYYILHTIEHSQTNHNKIICHHFHVSEVYHGSG